MKKKLKVKIIIKDQNRLAAGCFFVAGSVLMLLELLDLPCGVIGFICFTLALVNFIISVF